MEQRKINFSDIALKERIGEGGFGVVYRAKWNNTQVAVKESHIDCEYYGREEKQLSSVDHPNIIKLIGFSSDDSFRYLILEFAECGTLDALLHGNAQRKFNMGHALSWTKQCAEAVAYLHKMTPKPLLHRDLKPENILLADEARKVKLCDFGTVVELKTTMTKKRGTITYMAPEVMQGENYSMKCDVYNLGITFWEILSCKKPFDDIINSHAKMTEILEGGRPVIPNDWHNSIKELIASCWNANANDRPTMQNVVEQLNELMPLYPGSEIPIE